MTGRKDDNRLIAVINKQRSNDSLLSKRMISVRSGRRPFTRFVTTPMAGLCLWLCAEGCGQEALSYAGTKINPRCKQL